MNAGRALAVLMLSTVNASFALAQQAATAEKKAAAPAAEPGAPAGAPAGGLVVFIDPVTGKIRQPDAAEIGSLLSLPVPGAAAPLVEKPLIMKFGPGGAVGVVLDSRFETFMVVTKKPDGKLSMDCVAGGKKADEAVAAATAPAAPAGRRDEKGAADVR